MNYLIEVKGSNVSREIVGSLKDVLTTVASCLSDGYQVSITPTPLDVTAKAGAAALAYLEVNQMELFRKSRLSLVS